MGEWTNVCVASVWGNAGMKQRGIGALMQAELIGAAEEPNVSIYNLCRAAAIEARMEAASRSILPAPESAFGCIVGLSEDWCAT
jgi:hypothetical protein